MTTSIKPIVRTEYDLTSWVTVATYANNGTERVTVESEEVYAITGDADTELLRRIVKSGATGQSVGSTIPSGVTSVLKAFAPIPLEPGESIAIQALSDNAGDDAVAVSGRWLVEGPTATEPVDKRAPDRYAALASVTRASIGEDVTFTLSNADGVVEAKTVTVVDDYDNDDTATDTAANTHFDVADTVSRVGLKVVAEPASGSTATVNSYGLFDPDPDFGCAPLFYDAAHSGPTALVGTIGEWSGKLIQMVTEAGSSRRHLSIGRIPMGEVFSTVTEREPDDRYHQGSAIAEADGCLCLAMTDHQSRLYLIYGKTIAELLACTPVALTPAPGATGSTYCIAKGDPAAGGRFVVLTRYQSELRKITVTGMASGSLTQVSDTIVSLGATTIRPYPRTLDLAVRTDDQTKLDVYTFQSRDGATWEDICGGVHQLTDDAHFNFRGDAADSASTGTTATPRFSVADASTGAWNVVGNLGFVDGNIGSQRYGLPGVTRVGNWGASTKEMESVFAFVDAEPDTADAEVTSMEVRLAYLDGGGTGASNRIITASAANPFGLNGSDSFRVTSVMRWQDDDPTTGIVQWYMGVLSNAFTVDDDYNQFGADTEIKYGTIDLNGVTDAASLLAGVTILGSYPVTTDLSAEIRQIENSTGLIISEALPGSHLAEVRGVGRWRRIGVSSRPENLVARLLGGQATSLADATTAKTAAESADAKLDTVQTTAQAATDQSALLVETADIKSRIAQPSYIALTTAGSTTTVLNVDTDPSLDIAGQTVTVDGVDFTIVSTTVAAGATDATITITPALVDVPDVGTGVTIPAGQGPVEVSEASVTAIAAATAGLGGNVLQHDIDGSFVFELPSRKSGIVAAKRPIYLSSSSERPRFAFDVSTIAESIPTDVTAVAVLDAAGDPSVGLVVATQDDTTNCGVRGYLVMSKVTGATTSGTYTVRVTFTLHDTSTLVVEGLVVVP